MLRNSQASTQCRLISLNKISIASSSLQSLQRGNTVILLKILCLSGDLCRIELDLLWIFFGFDFDEPLDWVFYRFGQIVQRFDFFAVYLRYRQIGEFIVANSAVSRKDLAEDNNTLISVSKEFGLEMVEVNQTLRSFSLPVRTPFFEILTGKLLKNQATENIISRRLIEIVWWAHIILRVAVLEGNI